MTTDAGLPSERSRRPIGVRAPGPGPCGQFCRIFTGKLATLQTVVAGLPASTRLASTRTGPTRTPQIAAATCAATLTLMSVIVIRPTARLTSPSWTFVSALAGTATATTSAAPVTSERAVLRTWCVMVVPPYLLLPPVPAGPAVGDLHR